MAAKVLLLCVWLRSTDGTEALLDRFQHPVAHVGAASARAGDAMPGDGLVVVGIDDEGGAHHLAVPAAHLEAVRAPAQVGPHDDHLAVVDAAKLPTAVMGQQYAALAHDAEHTLAVHGQLTRCDQFPVRQHGNAAVAVGRPLAHQKADQRQQGSSIRLGVAAAQPWQTANPVMQIRVGNAQRVGDNLHRKLRFGCDNSRKLGFFRLGQRLFEDLHLHGLAPEQPFQFADALFEPAHLLYQRPSCLTCMSPLPQAD